MGHKGALCWKKKKKDVRTDGGTLKKALRGKGNIDEQKNSQGKSKKVLTFRKAVLYYTQKVKESQSQTRTNERAGGMAPP